MQRVENEPMTWSTYRAWNRACRLHAWRATLDHFRGGWRGVAQILAPGFGAVLILLKWGGAEGIEGALAALVLGTGASALWFCLVFCWYAGLAPYRLWCAAQVRIAHLTSGRRDDPGAIARELALCIEEGQALMKGAKPSKHQLSTWYTRVRRVVSRSGKSERLLLDSLGPAPGTRGGALELLILGNRIERLRSILARQLRPSR